jgi:hypothetical protein
VGGSGGADDVLLSGLGEIVGIFGIFRGILGRTEESRELKMKYHG